MSGYEQYAETPLGDNILAQIAETARDIRAAERLVEAKEKELKEAQNALEHLQKTVMVDLMETAGQKKLTTIDGLEVEIVPMMRGTPSKENQPKAYAWLREHKHGGIIKSEVVADLGKGDTEKVKKALDALAKLKITAKAKESVHHQTLSALVRELLARGDSVPLELLGIFTWNQANVKVG